MNAEMFGFLLYIMWSAILPIVLFVLSLMLFIKSLQKKSSRHLVWSIVLIVPNVWYAVSWDLQPLKSVLLVYVAIQLLTYGIFYFLFVKKKRVVHS